QSEDLEKKIKLIRGKVVTDALLSNTRSQVRKFYVNKGFLDTKVVIRQVADSTLSNSVALKIDVDKGSKVRIHDISFTGDKAFKDNAGPKYYFRNISWTGNYLYDSKTLSSVLGIKKGTPYSKETLDKRLSYNPTGQDVTSLYMNDGYLFFSIDPVETKVQGDSIDIEMRISEGVQARVKDI
nr:hypothetical protein [Tanacetum cinerariifolium]